MNATATQVSSSRAGSPTFFAVVGAALVFFVVGAVGPSAAAAAEVNVSSTPGYTGWAYVKLPTCAPSAWR